MKTLINTLQWSIYPFTIIGGLLLYYFELLLGIEPLPAIITPVLFGIIIIEISERKLSYNSDWLANSSDYKEDGLYTLIVQVIMPLALKIYGIYLIVGLFENNSINLSFLWPHHWNIWLQTVLMILVADFFIYWIHYIGHNYEWLWKYHAVHHEPKKLYWLNVSRFHPVEKIIQLAFDTVPFILVGCSEEVMMMYFVFFAINGFFQHCNINIKYGILNYVISTSELHRWHHSVHIEESNTNYGNNVIVWDLLFGTYFNPNNKKVGVLGLLNRSYPTSFLKQLKAPFVSGLDKESLPLLSWKHILLNRLIKLKMWSIKLFKIPQLKKLALSPKEVQDDILKHIISRAKNTEFGKEHNFEKIKTYEDYINQVEINEYDTLFPYIESQRKTGKKSLTTSTPLFYNQTSGTTGSVKLIPILQSTLKFLKSMQTIYSYMVYNRNPFVYSGKILGIVSPQIEGEMEDGTKFGSASGHIYANMPRITRMKYVLPKQVFEIKDYEVKYQVILLFALLDKNITCFATANSSTFLKLNELLNNKSRILHFLSNKGIDELEIDPTLKRQLKNRIQLRKRRIQEIENIFSKESELYFYHFWPYIKVVSTWTGGSCGLAIDKVKNSFPQKTEFLDLGYLSSEIRGTVTTDFERSSGIPTLGYNFFEFVLKEDWENKTPNYKRLHELEDGKLYYIFITTPEGLFRYNMNDIIKIDGFYYNTPQIRFIQKGKGITNITGEKLTEHQLIEACNTLIKKFNLNSVQYKAIGDEDNLLYKIYWEFEDEINTDELSNELDSIIQQSNSEYEAKRSSGRLNRLDIVPLKKGTFELYKKSKLESGQRESQFKILLLQLKNDVDFPFEKNKRQ